MTKWQVLSLIFIYLGTAYFADFLLSKQPFAFKSSFLLKITRFWRVLSKMEYSTIIQNGGSKTADASTSFFSNKWRHHDITAFVKLANFLILWNTYYLYFSLNVYFERNLDSANKFYNMTS